MPVSDRRHNGDASGRGDQSVHTKQRAAPTSGRRRWVFRIAALLLPVATVAIAELLLVACDVGDDLHLFIRVPGNPAILRYQVNPRAEESYFAGRKLGGPEPRRFESPQPDGVYRIIVVGGSTVLGFPYPPELSFSRQLEVLLNQQNADQSFEVINTGMVAINSFSVADVVEQSVAVRPDLIVVHTGHNEFYGPGGVASTTTMAPLAVNVRRRRLFQLFTRSFASEPPDQGDLMAELPATVSIAHDDPALQQAENSYRKNLTKMAATASSENIPIVFTTVASNLSNHSPVSFHLPASLTAAEMEQWRTHFDAGLLLTASEDWQQALEQFELAKTISGDSSLLRYRLGQCLAALERHQESRTEFESARDLDGCRFRAPGSFGTIVRNVATQAADSDVFFVDSAEQLAAETGPEVPGENLFLEHVHYNLEGHRRLALILSRFIQQQVLQREWDAARVPVDSEFDRLLGLLPEDRVSGLSYALRVMSVFPMSETFDVEAHRSAIVMQIQQALLVLDTDQQQVFADLSLDDMAMRLPAAMADSFHRKQQPERELYYRRCDQIRQPWDPDATFRLGKCLSEFADRRAEAIEHCKRALQLNPQHLPAQELLERLADSD